MPTYKLTPSGQGVVTKGSLATGAAENSRSAAKTYSLIPWILGAAIVFDLIRKKKYLTG